MINAIYHIDGYTCAGEFASHVFDTEHEALGFFDSCDWQEAECVAEIFHSDHREYKELRKVLPA